MKEKVLNLPNIYPNAPDAMFKKNFDVKSLTFSQSMESPSRIVCMHNTCLFDLKIEDGMVDGYSQHEVDKGLAIGMVPLSLLTISRLQSFHLLPNALVTASFLDIEKEPKTFIQELSKLDLLSIKWEGNASIEIDFSQAIQFPKFH